MEDEVQPRRRGFAIVFGALVLLLAAAGGVIAFYGLGPMLVKPVNSNTPVKDVGDALGLGQSNQAQSQANAGIQPVQVDEQTLATLMQQVAQQVQLPPGEVPQVNQIRDINKLAGQEFFAQAQNEDVVFVFPSKLVILYRPSTGKVVGSGTATSAPQP